MNEPTRNSTESAPKAAQTIGRRELLKALTAGSGAIAASTFLSGKWVKPVVEVGLLPAHAQASIALVYYGNPPNLSVTSSSQAEKLDVNPQPGPAVILIVVNEITGIANVKANNRYNERSLEINLNIDGTPSKNFTLLDDPCDYGPPGAAWSVVGYTLGDPSIFVHSGGGEGSWTVEVPLGNGVLPPVTCAVGAPPSQ